MEPTITAISSLSRAEKLDSNTGSAANTENPLGAKTLLPDERVLQLSQLYGPISESLARVELRLESELENRHESIGDVLRHGAQLGGKRMRPAMVLLAGAATGEVSEDHVVLGTVIEMVHLATLIHDDVLDGADIRRHLPTINAIWNKDVSILMGDYLFAQSFFLAATLGDTQACRWVGEAARRVCEGELRQILSRNLVDISESDYVDMIRGKTAELCRVACQLGALRSGASQHLVEALGRFGDAVGIAFQVADDYLDVWGDESSVGKTLGTDLKQGKVTLPVIRILATADRCDRNAIVDAITGPEHRRESCLRPMFQRGDAREYTRQFAQAHCAKAIAALDCVEDSDAKRSLSAIAKFAVDRKF